MAWKYHRHLEGAVAAMLAGRTPSRKEGGGASGTSKGRAAPVLVVGNSPAEAVQSSGASQSRIAPVLLDGPPSKKGPGRRGRWPKAARRRWVKPHRMASVLGHSEGSPASAGSVGSPGQHGVPGAMRD